MHRNTPDAATVAAYRRQLLEMHRQAVPPPSDLPDTDWLDSRYPEPDIERDKSAIEPSSPAPAPAPAPAPIEAPPDTPTYVGYLRVYVFTAGGAEPIPGAQVAVLRSNDRARAILALTTTDRDGFSPLITVPSVDPALTQRPGNQQPYTAYTIHVTAADFRSVEHRNVPVYGNNYVTQPVAMLPSLSSAEQEQLFISGGPTNL